MPQRKTSLKKSNWSITTDRFVGFIDIMGFKDFVARLDHAEVYTKLKTVLTEFRRESIDEPYYSESSKLFIFSDSIILFSKDNSLIAMKELLKNMRVLMERLLIDSLPFRGAIAFGKVTLDEANSIFFGQPLIDAYLLSEELLFYGIALHHTAVDMSKKDSVFNKRFLFHEAPMKNGTAFHHLISPFIRFFNSREIPEIIEQFRSITSGYLRKYIDNTEKFLKVAQVKQAEYELQKKL